MDTDSILQDISQQLRPDATLWVAFSGGLDSTTLLHMVSQSVLAPRVKAIHINHQISPYADDWEHHCLLIAHDFSVSCEARKVSVQNAGRGIEQSAREERYAVFEALMGADDLILFAHHKNDAVETLVFRLMRGAGLRGLSGMRRTRPLAQGMLLRPLLDKARIELLHYAQANQLRWVEDESNNDTRYDRNFLRHEVLPLLSSRWQHAEDGIHKTAGWLAEADDLLSEYAQQDLQFCEQQKERFGESLDLDKFTRLSVTRQKHVLRCWCDLLGHSLPHAGQLAKVDEVIHAREDAQPKLEWGSCELHRYQGRLFLISRWNHSQAKSLTISLGQSIGLGDGSELKCTASSPSPLTFRVRFRSGQERCKPIGRAHTQKLKKLLQEYRLEPWLRDRVPLLYLNETLVAVGDVFCCDPPPNFPSDFTVTWNCEADLKSV